MDGVDPDTDPAPSIFYPTTVKEQIRIRPLRKKKTLKTTRMKNELLKLTAVLLSTVCPEVVTHYLVSYYIKWVTTSWTHSMFI